VQISLPDQTLSTQPALVSAGGFSDSQVRKLGHQEQQQLKSGVRHLLLLDDNTALADLLTVDLEASGFAVTHVSNGAEGLRHVLARGFDVVLCDMVMPTLPGDLFYRAVERFKPALCRRFIFMTGYADDERVQGFIRGIDGLIIWKPFELQRIHEMIESVLNRATGTVGIEAPAK
jgi:DNA-binding response OmpR family regulator